MNNIVGTMLERGAKFKDIQGKLIKVGRSEKAARAHLMFLNKNGVSLLINGDEYQKGQKINPDDFVSLG